MGMKCAIFDADGTLLDSMDIWRELGTRYLSEHHITAEDGLADVLYSMSLEEGSRYLKAAYSLPDSAEAIAAELIKMIQTFYLKDVALKAGAADYLRYLYERKIPMIVATSNDKALLRSAFARLQLESYFQAVFTCSELNVSKREPTIYLRAAQRIGAQPQETVVFEDVLYGIQAAKSAGFLTVAVDDVSNRTETEQLRRTADYFIWDFTDLVLKTI